MSKYKFYPIDTEDEVKIAIDGKEVNATFGNTVFCDERLPVNNWYRTKAKEINKDSYRTNFEITGSLSFETKANDEENAEENIEEKMDEIFNLLSKECPGISLEIEYSQIEKV